MLKVGHVVSDREITRRYLYNICKYRISKGIKHCLITTEKDPYSEAFRKIGVSCHSFNSKAQLKTILSSVDTVNFHWWTFPKELHALVHSLQIPYFVTLYTPEQIPASIPTIICQFGFIKSRQKKPDRCVVIPEGVDTDKVTKLPRPFVRDKYSKCRNTANRCLRLIAPGSLTQCNDDFWILMSELLSQETAIELEIIRPGWKSVKRIKAINRRDLIFHSLAISDAALYLPQPYDLKKILDSFSFVLLAMTMGIPCILGKNIVTDELIHKGCGLPLRVDNPIATARRIAAFMHNGRLLRSAAASSQAIVKDQFDIKKNTQQYEQVITQVVSTRTPDR